MPATLADDFPRRSLIEDLARRLARHPAIERVWLFGSRARGDNFARSDIDLAVEAPSMSDHDWLTIKLDFEDEARPYCLSIWYASRMRPRISARRSWREVSSSMNESARLSDGLGQVLRSPLRVE